jgi:deoxyribodipyrimidine photo-lyase
MGVTVVWLKRDLRLADHAPLHAASRSGPVVVLYVYEPGLWARPEHDPCHLDFCNQSLADLDRSLRAIGGRVTFRTGRILDVLDQLQRDLRPLGGIRRILSHQETGIGWTFGRDRAVIDWCADEGVDWMEAGQDGVGRRLDRREGWARFWEQHMRGAALRPPESMRDVSDAIAWDHGRMETPDRMGMRPGSASWVQCGGETVGRALFRSFLRERAPGYPTNMSSPLSAAEGCSRISPHLAWGTVSMRWVFQTTERRLEQARQRGEGEWVHALETFGSRLRWRGHFMQRLETEPMSEFHSLQRAADTLRAQTVEQPPEKERFDAWCVGRTGWPMVDAVMRSLHATKWTSFRMRSLLASTATYTLWLPWRPCAVYLARHFLDFEPGIHFSQFQMQSGSTGINSLRIYNPVKQGRAHDPTGVFIRRWVPELRDLPTPFVHAPWTMGAGRESIDYPEPLVDFALENRRARERIERMRATAVAKEQAAAVLERHGSRKRPD